MQYPKRKFGVEFQPKGDVLAVVDRSQKSSFVLNATTAEVWQRCDGKTSTQQLATLLQQRFGLGRTQAEELVTLALGELNREALLEAHAEQPIRSRRQMLQAAMAAGLAVVLAPLVAKADGHDDHDHDDDDDDDEGSGHGQGHDHDNDEHNEHGKKCRTTTTTPTTTTTQR